MLLLRFSDFLKNSCKSTDNSVIIRHTETQKENIMKYTKELVWEAVYVFCPNYKISVNHDYTNLTDAIKDAAVACFLMENDREPPVTRSTDYYYAKLVLFDALTELRTNGYMSFDNTVTVFWG
jgi:hypothetical protein